MLKRIGAVTVAILFVVSLSWADDRRSDKSKLVVMSLNAEFMWDGVEPEEGRVNFDWKGSPSEAQDHMRDIANIIIRNNPDIVSLVEIEGENALNILNNSFLQGRGYVAYFSKGRDSYTGQDMGLLSKIDPEANQIQYDGRKGLRGALRKSVSKNYTAKFNIEGQRIALIGLHFLSGPNRDDRINKREAQADAVRSIGMGLLGQGYELIVLGDFNDYDGDSCCLDHQDSIPITQVLSIIKGMDDGTPEDNLVNVSQFIAKGSRYTAFWDRNRNNRIDAPKEFTSIDHILVSPYLASLVELAAIPHDHDPRYVTDHFPVLVHIRFGEQTGGATGDDGPSIRMIGLLPNPEGNENQNEAIKIKNYGTITVNLAGWKIRDIAGTVWNLEGTGSIRANKEVIITRNGQRMALNNGGDTVDLLDPSGLVIQSVTYQRVNEGEWVYPSK